MKGFGVETVSGRAAFCRCVLVDHMAAGVDLPERQLVVVLIVQHIHQICIERMHLWGFGGQRRHSNKG